MPALLHHELLDDDRESRVPPRGKVIVEFTIAKNGDVTDPTVVDVETDTVPKDWWNTIVLGSIVKWKYAPVASACRGRVVFNFTVKD